MNSIAVFGTNGAIGNALLLVMLKNFPTATIYSISRFKKDVSHKNIHHFCVDYFDETQLQAIAKTTTKTGQLDLVLVTNGILHDDTIYPEKALNDISAEKLEFSFKINTILPALIAKHFVPTLNKENKSIFAALSARVGSISDNRLGGWYGYRASKAALNMIIKTVSIETKRLNKSAIIIGLHPGTVASNLSKPFQKHIAPEKLFSPDSSAEKLFRVLISVSSKDSGKCFDWNCKEVLP
ncbi:SDR family NAD(P)-dependent oxidoreductase [bacterium]|nr:SDR family NAD(P)-dependent oxidoreductase [bacterium]